MNPEEAKRYVQSVMQRLDNSPDALSKQEFRLAKRFKESDGVVRKIAEDCDEMRSRIQQMQTNLGNAERQLENERGRCQGIVDSLVDLYAVTLEESAAEAAKPEAVVRSIEDAKAKKEEQVPEAESSTP